jgi:hypothetical protein
MKMKKREKIALDWFLEFIQTPLEILSIERRTELEIGLSYLQCDIVPSEKHHDDCFPWKWMLEPFFQGKYQSTLFPGNHLDRIQNKLRQCFKMLLLQVNTPGLLVPLPPANRTLRRTEEGYRVTYSTSDKPLMEGKIMSPNGNALEAYFLELFSSFPSDVLKRCPVCQKYFAHGSDKEKIFCTKKCAYIGTAKRRLEELKRHPRLYADYLKSQRKKMKKVYEERKIRKKMERRFFSAQSQQKKTL